MRNKSLVTKLSINLNKVALLRNQRHLPYPDPVAAGRTVIDAGAHGLTVHPRPDERHIRRSDVYNLAEMMQREGHRSRGIELNLEGNPTDDFLTLVTEVRPNQVTLVPDSPEQATSDHGWDMAADIDRLRFVVPVLLGMGARVSLFMDAFEEPAPPMAAVASVGADRIELYTGPYADAFADPEDRARSLARYANTARAAREAGLGVNAGHDLTLENLPALCKALGPLDEVSIGHAFTADALWMGFAAAVRAYLAALAR